MSVPAISLHHLTKRYGSLTAVDDVDLEVQPGELFGLLGPNGAGKTTLVRMMTGIVPCTEGQVRVAGVDVVQSPDRARRLMGVVPQALTSDLDLTGYENMDIFARFFDVPKDWRQARIQELLERLGLWERRKDLVKTYSGGMRRRLEIARGLIHKPKVLFLDEPTIGLDPQSRRVIWDLLRDIRQGGELTISLTTHYMDEAEVLCDRVAIVDRGKIVALGTSAELKARLPGSDTLELRLKAPLSDSVRAHLETLVGVVKVESTPDGVRVRADDGAELLPRLLATLESLGEKVQAARVSRISLEDVFIHVTGRSLRDEATGTRAQALASAFRSRM